jgi:ubiquitin carboxyl-terminal hydrolase 14
MLTVRVKWGKDTFEVPVDVAGPPSAFKASLEALTGVPAARQKIMGVKGGALKDDADLTQVGLSATKPLMLIGTAETAPAKPETQSAFVEDDTAAGHHDREIMSNGLVNLGNTCYFNSVIQALRVSPEFRERLFSCNAGLAKALAALYMQLDSTRDAVPPVHAWTALMAQNPQFAQTTPQGFPMQHDAQEALTVVLGSIGELESTSGLFRGESVDSSGSSEPFLMLRCHISQEVTILEAGIERGLGVGAEGRRISSLPQYLIVHMARFAWRQDTNENAKVLRPVSFPQVLDTFQFCSKELQQHLEPRREALKARRDREAQLKKEGSDAIAQNASTEADGVSGYYELASVVSHKGRTLDGGHYIAWAKKAGAWLVFDDDKVARVTEEDVGRLRGVGEAHIAYVLVYRCRDPDTGRSPVA